MEYGLPGPSDYSIPALIKYKKREPTILYLSRHIELVEPSAKTHNKKLFQDRDHIIYQDKLTINKELLSTTQIIKKEEQWKIFGMVVA